MKRKSKKSRPATGKTVRRSKPKVKPAKRYTKAGTGVPDPLGAWNLGLTLLPLTRESMYEE